MAMVNGWSLVPDPPASIMPFIIDIGFGSSLGNFLR